MRRFAADRSSDWFVSRRRLLATGGTALTAATAGCGAVAEFLASQTLKQVNVFNSSDKRVTGTITVTGPNGNTALDKTFTLAPQGNSGSTSNSSATSGGGSNAPGIARYDGVFSSSGTHTVAVELSDDTPVRGTTSKQRSIPVPSPSDQQVVVTLGAEETPIDISAVNGTE